MPLSHDDWLYSGPGGPHDDAPGLDPADFPELACHTCGGTGHIADDFDLDHTCDVCDGTGWAAGNSEPLDDDL